MNVNGIIFPIDWKKIIEENKVLSGSSYISLETLQKEVQLRLVEGIYHFEEKDICLALSGGIDSSLLAKLLILNGTPFTAVTVGSHENHPDVVHAKILQNELQFKHKIIILPEKRSSTDNYEDLFRSIAGLGFKSVICADTIDEMLGGYWMHKKPEGYCEHWRLNKLEWTFEQLWKELPEVHLSPMEKYAKMFDVQVILPYLAAHHLIRSISISQRINSKVTKIILREIAKKLSIPEEIINRPKLGLCSIWDK